MTFCPPLRSGVQKNTLLLQDFCKKAQWSAKKLRERGSNTARPTEKGGGGPRLARVLSISARRVVPIRSRRFGRVASIVTDTDTDTEGKTQKSPIPQSGNRVQLSQGVARSKLPLVPLANTRASARSVLLGLVRRSCIATLISGRRHIVHYI